MGAAGLGRWGGLPSGTPVLEAARAWRRGSEDAGLPPGDARGHIPQEVGTDGREGGKPTSEIPPQQTPPPELLSLLGLDLSCENTAFSGEPWVLPCDVLAPGGGTCVSWRPEGQLCGGKGPGRLGQGQWAELRGERSLRSPWLGALPIAGRLAP